MTKLPYNGIKDETFQVKEESHAFLETKSPKEPIIMDGSKRLNTACIESAKNVYKKRGNIYPLCGLLLAFVFIVWLIGLTMVREFQLADLRREVKELRDSVEEIQQRYSDDQLFDELREFEKQVTENKRPELSIYKDIPIDEVVEGKKFEIKFPDDDMLEYDEDDYKASDEDDDNEPGFYDDIDREDFLGEVMEANRSEDAVIQADGDENLKAARNRRFIDEASNGFEFIIDTKDGVQNQTETRINSHHTTRKPTTSKVNSHQDSEDSVVYGVVSKKKPLIRRRYNDYEYDEDQSEEADRRLNHRRRKHKSSQKALEVFEDVEHTTKAHSPPVNGNILTAQFHGDTSHHTIGKEYHGNGRLLHPHEVPYTAWAPAHWLTPTGMDTHFPIQDGAVTIQESGIYFVYAQIYFHDEHDTSAFKVYRSKGSQEDGILYCATMTHSKEAISKTNTCYTAGVFHINRGDRIFVKNLGGMRFSLMQPGKSFFGFIKLNDVFGR